MKKLSMVAGLILLQSIVWAGPDSRVRFGLATEYLVSPGYNAFLNDAYSGVSGGYAWLGLRAELAFKLNDRWVLQPQITGYFNSVDVQDSAFGSKNTDTNTMGIPALVLRFFPYKGETLEWSVDGEINKPSASTDLSNVSYHGGSVGGGLLTTLRFWKRMEVQLGYHYYPVDVTTTPTRFQGPNKTLSKTYDFGGIAMGIGVQF